MRFDGFSFGSITIDGRTYDRDVLIDRGQVLRRRKKASKPWRQKFGHTPLSVKEAIPWSCKRLVIGTGADGALPVMDAVTEEAPIGMAGGILCTYFAVRAAPSSSSPTASALSATPTRRPPSTHS